MNASIEAKKAEAVERMKLWGIYPPIIKCFEQEGIVSESAPPLGTCSQLEGEQLERVRKFEEKYKELQPEKYQDTIEHVIKKGNTPAGMHISIMVQEILDTLKIQPGETGFDATLGYGGHTKAMLACLNGQGHIYATDVDPEESAKTKKRLEELGYGEDILTIRLQNFCTIDEIAKEVGGFDFILADLGVSSMQIDNPKRGFSFKVDGPFDLRLNQEAGISAAERLDTITREELAGMLYENSDEPYCEELAKAITDEIRKGSRIDTTTKLREVIEKTLDFLPEKEKKDTIKWLICLPKAKY